MNIPDCILEVNVIGTNSNTIQVKVFYNGKQYIKTPFHTMLCELSTSRNGKITTAGIADYILPISLAPWIYGLEDECVEFFDKKKTLEAFEADYNSKKPVLAPDGKPYQWFAG